MTQKKTQPKKVSVTLAKHHTHAGEQKAPGEKISVTPDQRAWLAERGIVEGATSEVTSNG